MLKKISYNLIIQSVGKISQLTVMFVIGMFGGSETLGGLSYTLSIVGIASVLSVFGLDRFLLQKLSIEFARDNIISIRQIVQEYLIVLILVFFLALILVLFQDISNAAYFKINIIPTILVFMLHSLMMLNVSVINAKNKVNLSQLLSINGVSIIVLTFTLFRIWVYGSLSLEFIIWSYVFAYATIVLVGFCVVVSFVSCDKPKLLGTRNSLKLSFPFFLMSFMPVLSFHLDKIFLGSFTSNSDLGVYEVATRLGNVASFFLLISTSVFSPLFARYKKENNSKELFKKINRYVRLVAIFASVYVLGLSLFGRTILGYWGDSYPKGYLAMILAGCAQLVITLTGPVGTLLSMSGHQRQYSFILIKTGILLIVLDAILIPRFGINGASVALLISSLYMSLARSLLAHKEEGYSILLR